MHFLSQEWKYMQQKLTEVNGEINTQSQWGILAAHWITSKTDQKKKSDREVLNNMSDKINSE